MDADKVPDFGPTSHDLVARPDSGSRLLVGPPYRRGNSRPAARRASWILADIPLVDRFFLGIGAGAGPSLIVKFNKVLNSYLQYGNPADRM